MKNVFAKAFITIEIIMFGIVLFSFLGKHILAVKDISDPNVHYTEERWEITQSISDYVEAVAEHLENTEKLCEIPEDVTDTDTEEVPLTYKATKKSGSNSFFSRISNAIVKIEKQIEKYTNSSKIAGKQIWVACKKKIDHFLGLDMTNSASAGQNSQTDNRDIIAKTEEGQLGYTQDSYPLSEEIPYLVEFGLRVQESGRNFLILEPPSKYAKVDGYRDYSEEKYKYLHSFVDAYGIDQLIVGDVMKENGMTEKDIFFDTDFHWKPSSGILASGILADYLNNNYGYSIDSSYFDLNNFTVETQKDGFLGYLGKKVTLEYTDPDDFDIWYPTYDTDLTVWNSYTCTSERGSIAETLYWYEQLDVSSLYNGNKYEFYGLSDQALISIHNNLINDGSRLLVVKTSFANVMTPYLAASVENLDIIDLRAFDGSIMKYIEETNPDTVICVYGLSSYENFDTIGGLFDFR